jgi:hypothetical protein
VSQAGSQETRRVLVADATFNRPEAFCSNETTLPAVNKTVVPNGKSVLSRHHVQLAMRHLIERGVLTSSKPGRYTCAKG